MGRTAGVGVALYLVALTFAFVVIPSSDAAVPVGVGASVLLGLTVGRGWAVALAVIIYPLLLVQGCDPSIYQCDVAAEWVALTRMVPGMLLIAFGVVLRRAGEQRWARGAEANAKRRRGIS